VGDGDIHTFADLAEWLMHSLSRLARMLNHGSADAAVAIEKRIHYGARRELMELVGIRGIGRVRARKLYDSGLRSIEDIRKADPVFLGGLLGTKTSEKLLIEIGVRPGIRPGDCAAGSLSSRTMDSIMGNEQSTFSDFDK
jgi:helicase